MGSIDLKFLRDDLKDELLAINSYQAHIDATENGEIKKVLSHIRDEEKGHVAELVKLIQSLDAVQSEKFAEEDVA